MNLKFHLNGQPVEITAAPLDRLSSVLSSEFGLHSQPPHCGGGCGKCTVLVDNEPALSCLIPMFKIRDRTVLTYEGFREWPDCADIEEGFREAGFTPCRIHKPGYVFLVHYLLGKTSHPDNAEISALFTGYHPVCGGYSALVEGIKKAAVRRFIRHNE